MTFIPRRGRGAARLGALAAAISATALAIGAPAASAEPVKPGPGWHRSAIPVKGRANLTSVVTTGRTDAWAGGFKVSSIVGHPSAAARGDLAGTAVGRADATPDICQMEKEMFPTLMLRWNGRSWSSVTMPAVGRINFLTATGRNDVWASADCAMLHWDGRRWTPMSYPAIPGAQQSSGTLVAAGGPKDAWLIGGTYDSRTQVAQGYVQRWNGRQWRRMALPRLGDNWLLSGMAVRNSHDVWAAGTDFGNSQGREHLVLLHWNGRTWKRLKEPAIGDRWTRRVAAVRALSANDVWVVGAGQAGSRGGSRLPIMLHWNGHKWSSTPVPDGSGEINDVVKNGRSVWAVGDTDSPYHMYTLRWDGKRWSRGSIPQAGDGGVNGAAAIPGGGLWAVGATGDSETSGGPYPFLAHHA
ncbi:hypothetical protein AB0L00_33055 [Actinoallomurus sp. NPDC052308]|uniref:hypothetical protein n=1 Tax=Actinoallomurus sp. NPDC052308 TaxID=3155530 RepID=UPI00341521DB